jgi:hypothetical protein
MLPHFRLTPNPSARPGQVQTSKSWRPGLGLATAAALGLACAAPLRAQGADSAPGAKGAQVYCYMRSNGNIHEVSWAAAYALIKRQSASLFKTSPEHAAVMITEAVVQNPGSYSDCGRYLGDLYTRRIIVVSPASAGVSGTAGASSQPIRSERYGN